MLFLCYIPVIAPTQSSAMFPMCAIPVTVHCLAHGNLLYNYIFDTEGNKLEMFFHIGTDDNK